MRIYTQYTPVADETTDHLAGSGPQGRKISRFSEAEYTLWTPRDGCICLHRVEPQFARFAKIIYDLANFLTVLAFVARMYTHTVSAPSTLPRMPKINLRTTHESEISDARHQYTDTTLPILARKYTHAFSAPWALTKLSKITLRTTHDFKYFLRRRRGLAIDMITKYLLP